MAHQKESNHDKRMVPRGMRQAGRSLGFAPPRCGFATQATPDMRRALFRANKVLAGIVHDTVALEGNPFTFPEVKTLLEGVTVGGHKVEDADQVVNQAASWRLLFDLVRNGRFGLDRATAEALNALVAKGEAIESGVFRDGQVAIGGTEHAPPPNDELPDLFQAGVAELESCENVHEKAICAYLFMALHQFHWDGNKRTGRLLMNGVLLSSGHDPILVPVSKRLEFNKRMIEFYDSKDSDGMAAFLVGCSLDKTLTTVPTGEGS